MNTSSKSSCPACLSSGSRSVCTHSRYELLACTQCGLVYSNPMKAGDSHYYESFTEYGDKWEFSFVSKMIRDLNLTGSALDIGCGDGRFMNSLSGMLDVSGIDFNPKAIEAAKTKFGLQRVYCLPLQEFLAEYSNVRFNFVSVFHVLEHLENPDEFLTSLKKALAPNALLALSVPNPARWTLKAGYENWDYPPHHLTRWSVQSLSVFLNRHGFVIKECKPEIVESFSQVKSGIQDIIWKMVIHYFSFGLGSRLQSGSQDSLSENGSSSPSTKKNVYAVLSKLKMGIIHFLILILSAATFPFLTAFRQQGKSLLIIAQRAER